MEIKMIDTSATLLTKGKYCPENVVVTAKLQEKSVTENGTVTADSGYAGLSSVSVDVPASVPEEVATAVELFQLLTADNLGKVYRFTGETGDTYTSGDLYEVVSGEAAPGADGFVGEITDNPVRFRHYAAQEDAS